jgi:hypothetical protein
MRKTILIAPLLALLIFVSGSVAPGRVSLGVVGAENAKAGAVGCSWWNSTRILGVPIASGQYCVTVGGTRTFVDAIYPGYVSASSICFTTMTAEFFDRNWHWYRTYSTPRSYGCAKTRSTYISVRRYMRPGYVCSTLKSSGQRITSRCFGIF